MPDEPPLVCQWMLPRSLRARRHGVTVKEMAGDLGVTERTIRRDLDTGRKAGCSLEQEVGNRGPK